MHFYRAAPNASAEVVEAHVGMQGQEGHRHGGIGDAFGDHEAGESLSEGVVVLTGMPDGDRFGFPRFDWANGDGLGWHQ